jgi:hypothetical protein
MSRFVLFAVVLMFASSLFAGAPVPQEPDAKTLVAGLSNASEKVRNESAAAIRNRTDVLPWLRRATRSTDKDTVRRAVELLAPHESKRQEAVAKAIDACIRDGRIDLFMEFHQYWQPQDKQDLWTVGPRAAKAGVEEYAKSRTADEIKQLEEKLAPFQRKSYYFDSADAQQQVKGAGNWYIRAERWDRVWPGNVTIASIGGPTLMGGTAGTGHYFVLGSLQIQRGRLCCAFVSCDGDVWSGTDLSGTPVGVDAVCSMVVCRGNFHGYNFFSSVVLVEGDVDLSRSPDIRDSVIRASGEIRLPERQQDQPKNCTIEAHAKNPTAPYKFFELTDVGLSLVDDEEGLVVADVKADTPFGTCGIAKGDLIRAIDDIPPGHSSEFRKKLRRAMVRQGDCLVTVARADKTLDLPVFFPLPK